MKEEILLINRLKNRDERALSTIYDRYSGAIYGVIIRMCKNEVLAEEILQETFLKIWNNSNSFDPEKGKFYTWAYRIAKNTTLNTLRKKDIFIQNEDLSVYKDKEEDDSPIDYIELKGSIKKLEKHHQRAIELVYFNGLTHREAHSEMDVPLGTFKSYVRQALKRIKETYNKER